MDALTLHSSIVNGYKDYISSFINIADEDIKNKVDEKLDNGELWPDPLVQFNPAFLKTSSVSKLVADGTIHPEIDNVFNGFELYAHQTEAITLGATDKSFIVTSGTGSGKSLTYIGTIFNQLFSQGAGKGVKAILVYPMNALINSQEEELNKFAGNYRKHAGKQFPITFGAYTGQTPQDLREQMVNSPPDILLTNYMMLELMLTRQSEIGIRNSIFSQLEYLVFDELHTYRGRQGADVGMLVRRIKAQCANKLTCIGTSATMVSSGSLEDQKTVIAKVAYDIFGETFTTDQVIGETLARSVAKDETIPSANDVANNLNSPLPPLTREYVCQSALCIWLENKIALSDADDGLNGTYLKRGTPLSIPTIAEKLAEYTAVDQNTCEKVLTDLLINIHKLNEVILHNGGRETLLPYRLHQFFAQTGSVYATLGSPQSERFITLDPGLYHNSEEYVFPHVFSRASGHTYICVKIDQAKQRLIPREFSTKSIPEDSEDTLGFIIPEYLETDTHWNLEEFQPELPPSWLTPPRKDGSSSPKKEYKERLPQKIFYDEYGNYEINETSELPFRGWYMDAKKGLLFDPTAGLFFDGNTTDRTKLTTLGNEGRSTSTTVSSFLILRQLAQAYDSRALKEDNTFHPKNQKLLSFTDNRQDAALQSGHFNDFMRVSRIRGAVAKAIVKHPHGLNLISLGKAVQEELNIPPLTYAKVTAETAPFLLDEFKKALEVYVTYLAIYDIRRGWRVVLPNLEKCALLTFDYENLDQVSEWHEGWASVPIFSEASVEHRKEFLYNTLEHFRREYAIHSDSYLSSDQIDENRNRIIDKLKPNFQFTDNDDFTPNIIRLEKIHRRDRRRSSTLSLVSGFGKYAKKFITNTLGVDVKVNQEFYGSFIQSYIEFLKSASYLHTEHAKGPGNEQIEVYQLKLERLLWKQGNKTSVPRDVIKQRSYIDFEEQPNLFFQNLYLTDFSKMKNLVGGDHTGQLNNETRIDREERFRADWYLDKAKTRIDTDKVKSEAVSVLFCSPTMELGVDISNLNIVHMRNAPPNPASYAQRSGRAGRSGQAALVFTYCSSYSPHDRHYFKEQDKLVAGSVEAPRLDLGNRELIISHLNAIVLSQVNLTSLKDSVTNLLDHEDASHHYPMHPEVRDQLTLGANQKAAIRSQLSTTLGPIEAKAQKEGWLTDTFIDKYLSHFADHLDAALDRWRNLYTDARDQLHKATQAINSGTFPSRSREYKREERHMGQANHCLTLLKNAKIPGSSTQLSEFYVFRYLASEGFLPGYNFTRLPVRVFVASGKEGEYISRPRLIGLREFGPRNIIYHRGKKYEVNQLLTNNPEQALRQAKISTNSGYWLEGSQIDNELCPFTGADLSDSKQRMMFQNLIPLAESRARRRENITCEEEERSRLGLEIETYFSLSDGDMSRVRRANIYSGEEELLHLSYIPAAQLIQVNVKDRKRTAKGFPLGMETGIWHTSLESVQNNARPDETVEEVKSVMPYAHDTADSLYIEPLKSLNLESNGVLALQYALKRAIEIHFQIEPSELGVTNMGGGEIPNIFIYEAAEGSLGILSQLTSDIEVFRTIIKKAIEVCRYEIDPSPTPATYDDLLSYYNQPHHQELNRWDIQDALNKLLTCRIELASTEETYEQQYQRLLNTMDQTSTTEEKFLTYLYENELRLPDQAQKSVDGIYVKPDFYYAPDTWVFCDGTPHDNATVHADDQVKRKAITDRGDEVITYYYKDSLDQLMTKFPEIFAKAR